MQRRATLARAERDRRRRICRLMAAALAAYAMNAIAPAVAAPDDPLPRGVVTSAPHERPTGDDPPASVLGFPGFPTALPRGVGLSHATSGYHELIARESAMAGLPSEIAEAVMTVESGGNAQAIGSVGEIGLMQVLPATARMLGFSGSLRELAVPEVNVHYGVMYLAGAWRLAGRDLCTAVMKYRAGHGETRFSVRSVEYCLRVRAHLARRGYAVAGAVPRPSFDETAAARRGNRVVSKSSGRSLNLAVLNMQLRALSERAAANHR